LGAGGTPKNVLGLPDASVIQPNHVETVIASLPGETGSELWKYSRYFDPAGESRDALAATIPARSIGGLRRRTRAMNGRCQGFFCGAEVAERLERGARP